MRWAGVVVAACAFVGCDAEVRVPPETDPEPVDPEPVDPDAAPVCGDGVVDPSEACDDGNLADGDWCSSMCDEETCGASSVMSAEGPKFVAPKFTDRESFAIADLDDDGDADVAAASSGGVTVFANLGNHLFESFGVKDTFRGESVVIADADGDSDGDLVICDEEQGIYALMNLGGLEFQEVEAIPSIGCEQILAADLDDDGWLDIAIATNGGDDNWEGPKPGGLEILWGTGDAAEPFDPDAQHILTGVDPESVAIADFDWDGNLDLALANEGSQDLTVVRGQGGRDLIASPPIPLGYYAQALAAGDLETPI